MNPLKQVRETGREKIFFLTRKSKRVIKNYKRDWECRGKCSVRMKINASKIDYWFKVDLKTTIGVVFECATSTSFLEGVVHV
jgi:hypothetical protein